jgi:hypothetical protein
MKIVTKLALAGTAVLLGGMANAANVNTTASAPTGSSLILLLKNYSNPQYLMFELTPTVSNLRTTSQLQADTPSFYSIDDSSTTGPLSVPGALNGYSNANLTAYLGAHTGENIAWSIMGSSNGNNTQQLGQRVLVLTSTADHLNAYWDNTNLFGATTGMNSFINTELNGAGVTFTNGQSSTNGWDSPNATGLQADVSFSGSGFENGAALGTAQSLYLLATTGTAGTGAANVYKSQYTLTLNSAGVLSYNAPAVPVPAAVWLLGSGLMGLVGIGRRRRVALAA